MGDRSGTTAQVLSKGPLVPGQQEAELGEAGAVAATGAARQGGQGRGDAGYDAGLRRHIELRFTPAPSPLSQSVQQGRGADQG